VAASVFQLFLIQALYRELIIIQLYHLL
jgi:hypothetical protein